MAVAMVIAPVCLSVLFLPLPVTSVFFFSSLAFFSSFSGASHVFGSLTFSPFFPPAYCLMGVHHQ